MGNVFVTDAILLIGEAEDNLGGIGEQTEVKDGCIVCVACDLKGYILKAKGGVVFTPFKAIFAGAKQEEIGYYEKVSNGTE